MKRLVNTFIIVFLMLTMTACGFHLRGKGEDKIQIKEMALSAGDRYGPLVQELRERLVAEGVKIYGTAMYQLTLTETWSSRALSYSSSIRGTDVGRVLTLKYQIYGPNKLLLISNQVEARGQYVADYNNIVANSIQEKQSEQEIRTNAITLLMFRLQSISVAELESLQKSAEEQQRLQIEAKKLQQKMFNERRKSLLNSIPLDEIEQLNE